MRSCVMLLGPGPGCLPLHHADHSCAAVPLLGRVAAGSAGDAERQAGHRQPQRLCLLRQRKHHRPAAAGGVCACVREGVAAWRPAVVACGAWLAAGYPAPPSWFVCVCLCPGRPAEGGLLGCSCWAGWHPHLPAVCRLPRRAAPRAEGGAPRRRCGRPAGGGRGAGGGGGGARQQPAHGWGGVCRHQAHAGAGLPLSSPLRAALALAAPPCQAAVLPRRLARRGPVLRPVVRGAARGRPRHSQPLSAATRHPHTHRRRRPMPMCRLPARRLWLRWLPPPPTWCLTSRRYGGWMPRGRAPWAWCTGKQGGLCVYACVWTGERSRGCLVAQRSSRAGPGWYLGLQCTVWHVPTPSCSQNPSSATTHTHTQTHTHAHNHFPASPCSPQRPGAARRGAGGDGRRPPRHPPAAAGARPATAAAAAVLAAGAGAADDGRCVCVCGWWWWDGCLPACLPGTQPRPAYV